MTVPANIRVNTPVPFPSLVQGSGPITITKTNGIWTVGFGGVVLFNAVNDAAAAAGGIAIGGIYRNGSILMVRVT